MEDKAYDYLARDVLKNIDMLEILKISSTEVLAADDFGVLLRLGCLYLLSCEAGREAAYLPLLTAELASDEEPRTILLRNPALMEPLEREYGFERVLAYRHAVYLKTEPVVYTLPENTEIRLLEQRHLPFVHAHYHMLDDENYLRERIEEGMFGAFVGGALAGFVGTHEERSVGLLEVLPEYRRLGLATALEARLINHLLEHGRTPFCQIAIDNAPSLALQQKLGLTLSDSTIFWHQYAGKPFS